MTRASNARSAPAPAPKPAAKGASPKPTGQAAAAAAPAPKSQDTFTASGLQMPANIQAAMRSSGRSTALPGGVQPVTANAARIFREQLGFRGVIGGLGQRPNKSDHPGGLALDLMVDGAANPKTTGDALADFAIKNAKALGVKYVIWNRQIWNPRQGWHPYHGLSPHTDHVHVSFNGNAGYQSGGMQMPDGANAPSGSYSGPGTPSGGSSPGSWSGQPAPSGGSAGQSAPSGGSGYTGDNAGYGPQPGGGFDMPAGAAAPTPSLPEQGGLINAADQYGTTDFSLWLMILGLIQDPKFVAWAKQMKLLPEDWKPGDQIPESMMKFLGEQAQQVMNGEEPLKHSALLPDLKPEDVPDSLKQMLSKENLEKMAMTGELPSAQGNDPLKQGNELLQQPKNPMDLNALLDQASAALQKAKELLAGLAQQVAALGGQLTGQK